MVQIHNEDESVSMVGKIYFIIFHISTVYGFRDISNKTQIIKDLFT